MVKTSLDRWEVAHRTLGVKKCTECGAPEGHRVVRLRARPLLWSLDTDLHFQHPEVYRRPGKVVIEKDAEGVCRFCASPRGVDHVLHNKAVRRAKRDLDAQKKS